MFIFNTKKRINELKQINEQLSAKIIELEKQNNTFQSILHGMVEGVIAVDQDTRIVSVNPSIENIFGVKKSMIEGKFLLEAIRNNDIVDIVNNVLKKKEVISTELTLLWPVQKIFQVNASPILESGSIGGCLMVIHDITEIRRLETMRRDFVANVSHELKTPLTSIKGFVETLLEGALDDKENNRHFLKIIQNHAERLDELVSDLLILSHLESKEVILEKNDFNLWQELDEVILGFKAQLKKKKIEINNELPQGILIRADKDRIEQVVTNFIDNAIKFNKEKGFIKVYSEDLGNEIKIIVEDSGFGIPAKDIPRIFERFYRVDKARSRELGGTGLGLSIVKHIIELHGGSVGVESTEGFGSKFWFILPK